MILRRFIQHVKEQNWFAVGLDVIVVIVGIFLGMQVTDWNDKRNDRIKEQVFINELKRELLLYDNILETAETRYQRSRDAVSDLLNAIHSDEVITESEFNRKTILLRHHYRFADATATLQFLISDESYQLISNQELKKAISDISAFISLVDQFENEETLFINEDYMPFIMKHVDLYQSKENASWLKDTPDSKFKTEQELLLNSRDFSNMLVQRRNKLELVQLFRQSVDKSIQAALEVIEQSNNNY